jgi:glutathione S-transferase
LDVILIGMFDSPFVRRVAVSMKLLGMPFEHRNWSVGRALVPRSGKERRAVMRIMAVATGAAEKRHAPWVERCQSQMHAALADLERQAQARAGQWLIGDRMTQADITATCVYTFLGDALAINRTGVAYAGLAEAAARCESLPEFKSIRAEFFSPGASS